MEERNHFQEALDRARSQGKKPDKWVINGHVVSAMVHNRRNSERRYIDVVEVEKEQFQILGLPVRKSFKIDPMSVILAEGKKGLTSFTIPLVLDLTELEISV